MSRKAIGKIHSSSGIKNTRIPTAVFVGVRYWQIFVQTDFPVRSFLIFSLNWFGNACRNRASLFTRSVTIMRLTIILEITASRRKAFPPRVQDSIRINLTCLYFQKITFFKILKSNITKKFFRQVGDRYE